MDLTRYEMETILSFNEEEITASVYTHNRALIRKLSKLEQERPGDCHREGTSHEGKAGMPDLQEIHVNGGMKEAQNPTSSTPPPKVTNTYAPEATETVTIGQRNALSKAKDYLSIMAFSHSGLIKQLEFEGFTTEEATYGADNCGADWNEQAAKKAQSYLDAMSFSRQGLIDQLKYEGFTQFQAEYGVSAVGY